MAWFRGVLEWSMRRKLLVLGTTAALFALSVVAMTFVQQQFFPKSDRPELLVDLDPAAGFLDQCDPNRPPSASRRC